MAEKTKFHFLNDNRARVSFLLSATLKANSFTQHLTYVVFTIRPWHAAHRTWPKCNFVSVPLVSQYWISVLPLKSLYTNCPALQWQKYCWARPPEVEWVNERCDVKAQIRMPELVASWLASHLIFCVLFLVLIDLAYLENATFPKLYGIQHPCALSDILGICVGIYMPPPHSCSIWTLHIWTCLTPASPQHC